VLLEMEWVRRSRYGLAKPDIAAAFSSLLQNAEVVFEDEPAVEHAIYMWKDSPAEFADCLINARHRDIRSSGTEACRIH
jgi:predicted nucleic-acid-binding protein